MTEEFMVNLWQEVDGEMELQDWWVRDRMVLIPKGGGTGGPGQFRLLNEGEPVYT